MHTSVKHTKIRSVRLWVEEHMLGCSFSQALCDHSLYPLQLNQVATWGQSLPPPHGTSHFLFCVSSVCRWAALPSVHAKFLWINIFPLNVNFSVCPRLSIWQLCCCLWCVSLLWNLRLLYIPFPMTSCLYGQSRPANGPSLSVTEGRISISAMS